MARRKTADDLANDMLANVDLTHAVCERCNERTADTQCPYCKIAICDECLDTVHVPCAQGR